MGDADYQVLRRYVHLAPSVDLGPKKDWLEFILVPQDLSCAFPRPIVRLPCQAM